MIVVDGSLFPLHKEDFAFKLFDKITDKEH